jgi:hypothetical protein
MRLVLDVEPIDELEKLLAEASKLPAGRVKHIEVSRSEMKAIVNSHKAISVIPEYIIPRLEKLDRCSGKVKALRNNQELPQYRLEQQAFFDALTEIENQEAQITSVVPKQFTQSGVTIVSSIK